MTRITNKDITEYVRLNKPFKASSSHADFNVVGDYEVYSYEQLIAVFDNTGLIYMNDATYSQTTSKLQNMIRNAGV